MRFCRRHGRFLKCSSDIARLTSSKANQHKVSLLGPAPALKRVFQGLSTSPVRACLHLRGTSEYHLGGDRVNFPDSTSAATSQGQANIEGPRNVGTLLVLTQLLQSIIAALSPLSICCARCLRCTPELRPTEVESSYRAATASDGFYGLHDS